MSERRHYCNFCGKADGEVARLIAGPNVHVCNECVDLFNDILAVPPPYTPGALVGAIARKRKPQ